MPQQALRLRRTLAGIACCLLFAGGCSNKIDVLTHVDPVYDFNAHRAYMWAGWTPEEALPAGTPNSDAVDAEIRAAIDAELVAKGFHPVEAADLLLNYKVHYAERERMDDEPPPAAWDPSTDVTKYALAAFIVDFVDAKTQDRVWRGAAVTDIKPGKGRKRVEEVVRETLQDFPPKR